MLIIAITSQKGGVGKTTTAANLGAALACLGRRVLLLDMDPQADLTCALGAEPVGTSISEVLLNRCGIREARRACAGGMHLVPATARLARTLVEMADLPAPAFQLSHALPLVHDLYDIVLIDCPPTLGHAVTNALTVAHLALVPVPCEFLSLRGLVDTQEITAVVREMTNPGLQMRVLGTMRDRRTSHAGDVLDTVRAALPGQVCQTSIPRSVRLAEAPAIGQTILEYASDSSGAQAYRQLAEELLQEGFYEQTRRYSGGHAGTACRLQVV